MHSNRNNDFIIFGDLNIRNGQYIRKQWQKRAFRINSRADWTVDSWPISADQAVIPESGGVSPEDRLMWNISIFVLIAFIGLISFVIMNFVSPHSPMEIPTSNNSFSVTPKIKISQLEIFESMTLDEFYKLLESIIKSENLKIENKF